MYVQCVQAGFISRAGAKADHAIRSDQDGPAFGYPGPGGVETRPCAIHYLDQTRPASMQPPQVGVAKRQDMMAGARKPGAIGKPRAGGRCEAIALRDMLADQRAADVRDVQHGTAALKGEVPG